jgi:hypothetical protein
LGRIGDIRRLKTQPDRNGRIIRLPDTKTRPPQRARAGEPYLALFFEQKINEPGKFV